MTANAKPIFKNILFEHMECAWFGTQTTNIPVLQTHHKHYAKFEVKTNKLIRKALITAKKQPVGFGSFNFIKQH